jgi:hypothetical protein
MTLRSHGVRLTKAFPVIVRVSHPTCARKRTDYPKLDRTNEFVLSLGDTWDFCPDTVAGVVEIVEELLEEVDVDIGYLQFVLLYDDEEVNFISISISHPRGRAFSKFRLCPCSCSSK